MKIFLQIILGIVFVVLFCITALISLIHSIFNPSYELAQEITDLENTQIEIVYSETSIGTGSLGWYDYELVGDVEISVIRVIENNEKEAFLSDFNKLRSYHPFGTPIGAVSGDKMIRITYPDGEIELISDWGTANIKDGQIRVQSRSFNEKRFATLIDQYS